MDGLRGLAAFYVMVGHARWLLWEGYTDGFQKHPQDYSALNRLLLDFFAIFKYGHNAVLFFFVLSGFVIHLRYARRIAEGGSAAKFDWLAFVWRRARRLYPPLVAALLLALLLDNIGQSCHFTIYEQATPYAVINDNVMSHLGGLTLLGNLAYLMNTYVPVYGCNGPLWSLKYEWWFYMFYPVFWWLSRHSIPWAAGLLTLLFIASFYPAIWPLRLLSDVFSGMISWWLGVLLADVYAGRLRWRWETVISAGIIGCILVFWGGPIHDLGMSFGFTALLAFGFLLEERGTRLSLLEKLKPLGDMSYTLYVTHFPILVLGSGWLMSRSPDGLLPRHFGWVFCGIGVTLLFAYALHLLVERPFLHRAGRSENRTS